MDIKELRANTTELIGPKLSDYASKGWTAAVIGFVAWAIGAFLAGPAGWARAMESYLIAYLYWFGITAGSLGLLMLHHTVGGGWGFILRRPLEAAVKSFPIMGLLFIPIALCAFGVIPGALYSAPEGWASNVFHDHAAQELVKAKSGWLNPAFWTVRAVIYFGVFILFASRLRGMGDTQDERADGEVYERLNYWGARGLVVFVLTVTFISVDWLMSLNPTWFSSIFGLLTVVSMGLSTLALMLFLLSRLLGDKPILDHIPHAYFRDLGNLTLAFTLLWAYMAFSQYLITFSGNTVEEVSWNLQRKNGGWGVISLLLIPFHFAFPFLVLLVNSPLKRTPRALGTFVLWIVFWRLVDTWWLVAPTFRPTLSLTLSDVAAPIALGGIWIALWAGNLKDRRIVPLHDPRLEANLHEVAAHHG